MISIFFLLGFTNFEFGFDMFKNAPSNAFDWVLISPQDNSYNWLPARDYSPGNRNGKQSKLSITFT